VSGSDSQSSKTSFQEWQEERIGGYGDNSQSRQSLILLVNKGGRGLEVERIQVIIVLCVLAFKAQTVIYSGFVRLLFDTISGFNTSKQQRYDNGQEVFEFLLKADVFSNGMYSQYYCTLYASATLAKKL
jgi:hypothetical protein